MPRAFDRLQPQALWDPTRAGTEFDLSKLRMTLLEQILAAITQLGEQFQRELIVFIKELTGLDFTNQETFLLTLIDVLTTGGPLEEHLQDFASAVIDLIANLINVPNLIDLLPDISMLGDVLDLGSDEAIDDLTSGQWFIDLMNLLGDPLGMGTGNPITSIPPTNVGGVLGPENVANTFQATVDSLWQAFTNSVAEGNSLGFLADAARQLSQLAFHANTLGESNSATWYRRAATKPSYLGIDPSADAVFHLFNLNMSTTPTTVDVTSSNSRMGMIGTPDGGIKKAVAWLGQDTTSITGMYINLWQMNLTTGALTLVHHSANIIGAVSTGLTWNYYDMPDVTAAQGNWYAAEMHVTGTGTYKIVGMPNHWLDPNDNVYPSALGLTRASPTVTPPSTITTPTYSAHIPWFALTGSEGVSEHSPETTVFNSRGSYTYTIPTWATELDVVLLSGGGGGAGSAGDDGGNPGQWNSVRLVRGTHIPAGTLTLSLTVGAGGTGGGIEGSGDNGGSSSAAGTGWGGLSITGGLGGPFGVFDNAGGSPGNYTFNSTVYTGGLRQTSSGADGNAPGGGGAGALFAGGGRGADGAIWVTARQGFLGVVFANITATISGRGILSATRIATHMGALAGHGSLTAIITPRIQATAALAGRGWLNNNDNFPYTFTFKLG